MQIDFGEKWLQVAALIVRVFFFVAVLGYSRRIFVRASRSQRQHDWRVGLASAFRRFGGVTHRILLDRAGAHVIGADHHTRVVKVHPAFAAFCKDWGVEVSACRPYRARTKGKTESGIGYVKRRDRGAVVSELRRARAPSRAVDGRGGRADPWNDARATMRSRRARRARDPAYAPRSWNPDSRASCSTACRERLLCRCRHDPPQRAAPAHRSVEVLVGDNDVQIFEQAALVARHARCLEPHSRVVDPACFDGIYRQREDARSTATSPLARSLDVYAAAIGCES